MALSKEVLDTIAFSKQNGFDKLNLAPPEETRKAMAKAAQDPGPTVVANVISKNITHYSIPVRIYVPYGEGPFPLISYYHGGGFVLMGLETHDEICRQICKNTACVVMSVDYKLAPEHPYPQAYLRFIKITKIYMDFSGQVRWDNRRCRKRAPF